MRQFACRRRKMPSLFGFTFYILYQPVCNEIFCLFQPQNVLNLNNEQREIALHSEVLFLHSSYRSMAYNRHFYLYKKYRNLGPIPPVLALCMHSHLNTSFFNCHLHLQMVHLISNWHILMALLIYSLWLIPVETK